MNKKTCIETPLDQLDPENYKIFLKYRNLLIDLVSLNTEEGGKNRTMWLSVMVSFVIDSILITHLKQPNQKEFCRDFVKAQIRNFQMILEEVG